MKHQKVAIRREAVARLLSMSVTSIKDISTELGVAYATIDKDIQWIKQQTRPMMFSLARDGYAHDCFMAMQACMRYEADMEKDLQELIDAKKANNDQVKEIQDTLKELMDEPKKNAKEIASLYRELAAIRADNTANFYQKLNIRKQLVETKIARLNIEGEGPTLMAVRNVITGEFLSDAEQKKSKEMRESK